LPSEGEGHTFESCRVRHCTISQDAVRFRRHNDPLWASLALRHAFVDALASGEMDGRSPDRATL